eukprot:scaffold3031_cov285-Pinguiococcus_pyrenoidosus.AAC.12
MSAPRSSRNVTRSLCPLTTAAYSAVVSFSSEASRSAPRDRRSPTTCLAFALAAAMSGVAPLSSAAS